MASLSEATHVGKLGRIKPRYGYYETSDYPIGGCFRRAGELGVPITVTRVFESYHGCNAEGTNLDGKSVAFDLAHIDWNYETPEIGGGA